MLGYLSPEGKFYECDFLEHNDKALELLAEVYKVKCNNPQRLCDLGWCIIQSFFIGFPDNPFRESPLFTSAQIEWLQEHEEEMNYEQKMSLGTSLEIDSMLKE